MCGEILNTLEQYYIGREWDTTQKDIVNIIEVYPEAREFELFWNYWKGEFSKDAYSRLKEVWFN